MSHALIVDDDSDSADMLAELVAARGFTAQTANSLREARGRIALQMPDLVLLDLQLPDGSGMELCRDADLQEKAEIVLITGHASLETSLEALRLGAADYLIKPIQLKQLEGILSRVMPPATLNAELADLASGVDSSGRFGRMVGVSPEMRRVYEQVTRVAGTAVSVFVTGESGTGKEVLAQTIHELSRRRKQPFLAVNCGALSPNLIESELFGHEKGSFTGAVRQHRGFFEQAHGGTLLLDEITEMPLELQVKLLRVLETGSFLRVGSSQPAQSDVRIIAATNRPPQRALADGKLREDLLYRLNVFPIFLPPLRERADDIKLLAEHFLKEIGAQEGVNRSLSDGALHRMQAYHWPGNVRELRNAVQRAWVMSTGSTISEEWLPLQPSIAMAPAGNVLTVRIGSPLADVERELILATLGHFKGHKEKTAAALGVSLKTLYNRLKEYGRERSHEDSHEVA